MDLAAREVTAKVSGVIDGMALGAMVPQHATLLDALYSPYVWLFNKAAMNTLSAADQSLVRQAARQAIVAGRAMVVRPR